MYLYPKETNLTYHKIIQFEPDQNCFIYARTQKQNIDVGELNIKCRFISKRNNIKCRIISKRKYQMSFLLDMAKSWVIISCYLLLND